ncbi:MAG: cytochrome P460 family protein [Saprospiraceae bacterium]|nr:cytochrome P460 family protein [Pyrinomonadaceae bacterium]
MNTLKCFVFVCGVVLYWAVVSSAQSGGIIPYPSDYRKWTHVKSGIIDPGNPLFARYGGMHHIYANTKAIEGFRTGRFRNGSVIVFDVLELQRRNAAASEGPRRFIDVMQKDNGRFEKTGGWGFEKFRGSSRTERVLNETAKIGCFNCHAGQKARDYVFSSFRE